MMADYTPRRIVSLQPSATVTLARLGLLDCVVACTRYCADVCPEAAVGRFIVADSWTAQAEQIRAAHPDLVIASVPYQAEAVSEILRSGARFLGLAPKTLRDIYGDIAAIAGIMSVAERGSQVVAEMQHEIQGVRDALAAPLYGRGKTPSVHKLRVYCEEWGKPMMQSQPWVAELVEAAGGQFVGAPGARTDATSVLASDPDILIFAWCGAGDRVPLEKVVEQRGWQQLRAVRDGRVFAVRDELLNTPAPTLTDGLRALAWAIHPGVFAAVPGIRRIS
jgi:iron complex transport system substrate-binding protein